MFWKAIKKVTKVTGIIVGSIVGLLILLIGGYWFYNTPLAPKYKHLTDAEMQVYLRYLDTTVSEPLQFVSDKFRKYDVVLIGEMHRRRQDVEIVKALIPFVHARNGVRIVAWEFGASDFQQAVDSVVNAPNFDAHKAIDLMRRSAYYWDFQEYLDIYRVVWEVNHSTSQPEKKMRFLQLGSDYNERKLRSPDPQVRMDEAKRFVYDKKMADIVEREGLLKGEKVLWYSGLHHAFTFYQQPTYLFRTRSVDDMRGGNFLQKKYPGRLYLIAMHMPVMGRWVVLSEVFPKYEQYFMKMFYPFGGVLDRVYERRATPFACDTRSSPFGDLQDDYSYYSVDRWGSLKLKDFCDGYIVPCSFDEAQPVHAIKDWITSEAELREVTDRMLPERAANVKNIAGFLQGLEQDIPKTIRSLHAVDKSGY